MMNNKTMNIIPISNKNRDGLNPKYEQYKGETDNCGFWYLHGKLEAICGFDKAIITNCKELGLYKETIYDIYADDIKTENKMYAEGVYDCIVDGIDEPCVGYFYVTRDMPIKKHPQYRHWMQRGLVCLKSDTDACKAAEKAMKEKTLIL